MVKKGRSGRHWLSNGAIVMRLVLPCVWTISSAVWSEMAWADPITFQDHVGVSAAAGFRDHSGRATSASESREGSTSAAASASVQSGDGYLGSADVTVSLDKSQPLHVSGRGTGNISASTPSTNETGSSFGATGVEFDREFSLLAPHTFSVDALFVESEAQGFTSSREYRVILAPNRAFLPGDEQLFFIAECFEDCHVSSPITQVRLNGLLPPGPYFLQITEFVDNFVGQAGSTHSGHEEASFDLDLTPVPEPAAIVLLGSGLLGFLGIGRCSLRSVTRRRKTAACDNSVSWFWGPRCQMRLTMWMAAVGLGLWPAPVSAGPIRIIEDLRAVEVLSELRHGVDATLFKHVRRTSGDDLDVSAGDTLSSGAEAGGNASLTSSLAEPYGFTGTAETVVDVATAGDPITSSFALARARFEIGFHLDAAQAFRFSHHISGVSFVDGGASSVSHGTAALSGVFFHEFDPQGSTGAFERGVLPPGDYDLVVDEVISGLASGAAPKAFQARGDFSFKFGLTPVPEPTSLVLLGSGLLGLFAFRQRRA